MSQTVFPCKFFWIVGASLKEVIQGPDSKIVPQGGSVTFDCTVHTGTCDGEHSVYWFRHESHQGILHMPRDRWKHVPSTGPPSPGSPSASCVYHLQKMNLSSSDAGTYYCAVASCGGILFGNGSKLFVQSKAEDQMAKMKILVWLSIIRTGILLLCVTVCLLVYVGKTRHSRWECSCKSESLLQLSSEITQYKYKNILSFFVTLFNKSNFQKAIVCLLINRLWFVEDDAFCGDIIRAYNIAMKSNNKTVLKKEWEHL